MKCLVSLLLLSLTAADNSAVQEFINGNNIFAKNVYTEIAKAKNGNFLVSPFSAETILAYTQSGCKGETAEEIRNALHLPNDKSKVESAIKTFLSKFKNNQQSAMRTANKVYTMKGFPIRNEFASVGKSVYLADSEEIDFVKNVEAAKRMNDWVEKETNNKIKNLIDSESLDEYTRAVLINALYFKANWSNPFPLVATGKRAFYKTPTDSAQVDFLQHFREYFNYYECPHLKAQFIELPFQGGEASMVIVLPSEKNGLSSLESQLDMVFAPQHELQREYLNVVIPKFKVETSIDFKSILQNLGVKKIFEEKEADLSGIAGVKGDLVVNKVAQKTFIDVSEEGVEAAAATFVLVAVPVSAPIFTETPKDFIADHPFIFYIKVKGMIIFAGRVTDPSKH